VVAAIFALAYVVVIMHFAINIPSSDEWVYTVPLVDAALHGHVTLGLLWQSYSDGHWFLPNLVIVPVGLYDHLNIRVLISLSALLMVASFGMLLGLTRPMIGRRIQVAEALAVGVTFFSLGGVDKALWGLGLPVFMVLFFTFGTFVLLHLATTRDHALRWLVLAMVTAAGASLSSIQGLLVWPLGLVILAWCEPKIRENFKRIIAWCVVAVVVGVICLIGSSGPQVLSRSPTYALSHPMGALSYFFVLAGSLSSSLTANLWSGHQLELGLRQGIGIIVLAVAAAVVAAQMLRSHRNRASWLPVVLIAFGLSWDLVVAAGRFSRGIGTAVQSAYQTPQVLIATGIVVGAISMVQHLWRRYPARRIWTISGTIVFGLLLGTQVIVSDVIGLQNATWSNSLQTTAARDLANLAYVPPSQRACYVNRLLLLDLGTPVEEQFYLHGWIPMAKNDQLSMFAGRPLAYWHALGPEGIFFC
jgi:hypothetical protein